MITSYAFEHQEPNIPKNLDFVQLQLSLKPLLHHFNSKIFERIEINQRSLQHRHQPENPSLLQN